MSRGVRRLALFCLLMLTACGLRTLQSVWAENENAEERLQALRAENERQRESNARLARLLAEQGGREELERIGREQLFLFYPDEKIFMDTGN